MKTKYLPITFLFLLSITLTLSAQNNKNETLLLISWDGGRWDYLNRGITPNVQSLIEKGVRAVSLEPAFPSKTFPNHYSIVTGLFPQNHGITWNAFTDMITGNAYRKGDKYSVKEDKWYKGESIWMIAKRAGLKSAVLFWPGSETEIKHPDRFLNYNHHMPHQAKVDTILSWLNLPDSERPKLILLYFPDTDDAGHKFGPTAPEVNQTLAKLDNTLGEIIAGAKKLNRFDKMNIMLVSDHGMTKVSRLKSVDIKQKLKGISYQENGGDPNKTIFVALKDREKVWQLLNKNREGYHLYKKAEIPERFNIKESALMGNFLIALKPGYHFSNSSGGRYSKGAHGYDNRYLDMHGIFVGAGPGFKKGYQTGTIKNIDLYPLMCALLNIEPAQNIDGKLHRVEHLLIK